MYRFVNSLTRRSKRAFLLGVDMALAPFSLFLAFCLQQNTFWPSAVLAEFWTLFPLITVLAGAISIGLGIPDIQLKTYEARAILKTGGFAGLLALVGGAISGLAGAGFAPAVLIIFGVIFFSFSVTARLVGLRLLLWIYRQGHPRTRVLIYGAGGTGVQLATAITQAEDIDPVGFVDDNKTLQKMMVAGLQVYSPARIPELVATRQIDRVVLAMPSLSLPLQAQIARRLEKIGCDVHRLPSFSELIGNRNMVKNLEPVRASEFLGRSHLDKDLPGGAGDYTGKNILVSGAGGSIGSELCRQLLAYRPARIVLFEQSEPALYTVDLELRALTEDSDIKIEPVLGSTCTRTSVSRTLTKFNVDIILHAAAHKHVPLVEVNGIEGLRNNILGTKILADVARDAGVKRFILVSSDKAVRPTNVMGASKRLAELIVQDMAERSPQTLFSMVRFGNVLGSSGSVVPLFSDQIARGGPVTLTDTDVTRYFMTLQEAARLVLLAGSFARGGDVFVLDMGKPIRIRDLARKMIERAGYSVRNKLNPHGDIEISITGLRPGEKLYEELLIGSDMQTTPHPKILRAQEEKLSEIDIANMLLELNAVIESGDPKAAENLISRWVTGFHQPECRATA
jgi:FlaA1/EpsC-like NDP-sugar epimerase